MNNEPNSRRRLRMKEQRRERFFDALENNPVVSAAAGASIIAGACVSLPNALVLCAIAAILLPAMSALAAAERQRLSESLRPAAYFICSCAIVFLCSLALDAIFPESVTATGIFAPLLACEALVLCSAQSVRREISAREAACEGAAVALSFSLIALPVGLIRETIGRGEFFGLFIGLRGSGAFTAAGMGFILCGAALAIYRALRGANEPLKGEAGDEA